MPAPGIIIINTCTVTSKADQKSRRLIRRALRDNSNSCVLVTGCYAQLDTAEIALLEAETAADLPAALLADVSGRRLFVLGEGNKSAAGMADSMADSGAVGRTAG
jgi:threonylcarbamoyladenosine tRNA methylthiotransferase MtaB